MPEHHEALSLLPDFMPYHFDTMDRYQKYLKNLIEDKSQYLKVEGVGLKKVNGFVYAWQHIKGWFGFENLCDEKRVQYTLQKLSFWGYLKGYNVGLE